MANRKAGKTSNRNSGEDLVFMALGGLGEMGMNAYLYGLGAKKKRQWLMVDLGLTFPGEGEPGVDVILPNVSFIEARKDRLAGIVLTHAHEDHFGAVIDLWPRLQAPIYATPFTAGLLKAKLADFGGKLQLPIHEIELGARFDVGPFDIEMIGMAHSIPEPNGLAIRTSKGLILHTGDWKLDDRPVMGEKTETDKLKALGDEGVLAMVCDSTNAFRDGISPSESDIADELATIIKDAPQRVAVTTFASNAGRLKAVGMAAQAAGRKLVVCGRAMHRIIKVAIDTGYLAKDFKYLDQRDFSHLDRNKVVALCTGSQGEPRAAMARIAADDHPDVTLTRGDMVIFSSRTIPGNEKSVGQVQNQLTDKGCQVITDSEALVHVTGHPRREELKRMYEWVRPKIAVPMHGEARHLNEHARLARHYGVPEVRPVKNGQVLRLAQGNAEIVDRASTGRIFRDGRLIIDSDAHSVRDRRRLAVVGVIFVAIAMSKRGDILSDAEVDLDGVPLEDAEGRAMEDYVFDAVYGTIDSVPRGRRKDADKMEESIKKAVRAAVAQVWGKRPIVKVMITRVDG